MTLNRPDKFGDDVKLWIGQIVEDATWKDNEVRQKWTNINDLAGWGARYKVRIMSQHSDNKSTVTDENLPMVDVMYPVTGGSGHAASFQSANLRQGSFVIGCYRDGNNRSEPLILGCLGNNDQTILKSQPPSSGFVPQSGLIGERVPAYSIPSKSSSGQGGSPGKPTESVGGFCTWESFTDVESRKRGEECVDLRTTHKCKGGELQGVQLAIVNLIKRVESIKKRLTQWQNAVSDFSSLIKTEIEDAARWITKRIKNIIEDIRQYVVTKVNNGVKDLHYLLFPNQRGKSQKAVNKVLDLISCLFDKIIDKLLSMILDFLMQIVDRYINAPLCAIEKFLTELIGNLFGYILGAIDKIVSTLTSVFGTAINIAGSLIGFFIDLLKFLTCEKEPDCPEIKQWSIWNGAGSNGSGLNFNIDSIIDDVMSTADKVKGLVDPDNFDFNIDFSSMVTDSINNCGVGPILCGPPKVEFYGGGGSGAAGNVVIGITGEILGIDMTNYGAGYTSAPFAKIVDSCGTGTGAVLKPRLGNNGNGNDDSNLDNDNILITEDSDIIDGFENTNNNSRTGTGSGRNPNYGEGSSGVIPCPQDPIVDFKKDTKNKKVTDPKNIGVVGVVVLQGGTGYLSYPDGSLGGEGRTWAEKNQTVVRRVDGKYDPPYYPGQVVTVNACDEILPPYQPPFKTGITTDFIAPDPEIPGDGESLPIRRPEDYDPNKPPKLPSELPSRSLTPTNDKGQYDVVLSLCEVYIENPGINYSKGDKITVTPSNNVILEPVFGAFGALERVIVVNAGSGFKERPVITIESETGYNAKIIPVLCVSRIGDTGEDELTYPDPDQILKVVDCVGKNR